MKISEYVTIGHPDKVADFISSYILDRHLEQDPYTRYALEVQIKTDETGITFVSLGGEITTNAVVNYTEAVKAAIRTIGYTDEYAKQWGAGNTINPSDVVVIKNINKQSNNIAQGVNNKGWGDQGIMFGMATNTPETNYMPKDYYYAKKLGQALFDSKLGGLDIKTQVVMDGDEIKKVIVAIPTKKNITMKVVKLMNKTIPITNKTEIIVNGTGSYVCHASAADCGTTGRKLAVDFYGGNCKIGGGSPWTKDGTKADLTLNMFAHALAVSYIKTHKKYKEVEVAIGCCIGKPEIDITITANGKTVDQFTRTVTPEELIEFFHLREPIFAHKCLKGLFE